MTRSVILVDGRRAKIIDVDTCAERDATVTIEVERSRPDSTGIGLKLIGFALMFAIGYAIGWPALLLLLLWPALSRI